MANHDDSDPECGELIPDPPAPPVKVRRGRPTSRSQEAVLCHVWRLVYMQTQLSGDSNISKACRAIMLHSQYRGRLLIFNDDGGQLLVRLHDWNRLRQWWFDAEKMRSEGSKFPVMAWYVEKTRRDVAALLARRSTRES